MSQIQNSCLNKNTLLEPVALLGLALFAGSTRAIQYIPGASKGGLLMTAGLASLISYSYNPTLNDPEYNYLKALAWKGAAIALAAVCTNLIAKPLKGRVDLSFNAAVKFGLAELVVAAIITKATQESPLQRKHTYYTAHQKEWLALDQEVRTAHIQAFEEAKLPSMLPHTHTYYTAHQKEWLVLEVNARTVLVQTFYEADLPAISLLSAPINRYDFFDKYEDLKAKLMDYSGAQLSWYCELLTKDGFTDKEPADYEFYFPLMHRCQETGIEMFRWAINQVQLNTLKGKPAYIDMLYNEFSKTPIYRHYCEAHAMYWDDHFLSFSKVPFPSLENIMAQLNPAKVEAMDADHLRMWNTVLIKYPDEWKLLSEPIQTAFLIRFFEYRLPYLFWEHGAPPASFITYINALSTEEIEQLNDNQINWFVHMERKNLPIKLAFNVVYEANKKARYKIPYALTSEVVKAAEDDCALFQDLIDQFEGVHLGDFGFSTLSPEDQDTLKDLFGERNQHLLEPNGEL